MRAHLSSTLVALVLLGSLAACGKKGPPLAPLHLVPAAVAELTARRTADEVELRFSLPTANANGPEQIDLSRIEVYAITIGPGSVTPPNRDLLTNARLVGTIAVRPPPVEGETPAPNAPPDKRPAPGEHVTFVEQLTAVKLTPVVLPKPDVKGQKPGAAPPTPEAAALANAAAIADAPATTAMGQVLDPTIQRTEIPGQQPEIPGQKPDPAAAAAPGATAVASSTTAVASSTTAPDAPGAAGAAAPVAAVPPVAAPVPVTHPTRIYAIRGLSKGGRPGLPSARIVVPLLDPVAPPSAVAAQMPTEKAVVVDWTPPVAEAGSTPLVFNVYRRDAAESPLNPAPIAEPKFEVGGVELGKEQCFVVRTVQKIDTLTIESAPSAPACLTPLDKFPPAAPKNLRAVAEDGAVSLVWDQSTEADLDGYLVLRAEAPGGTLTPITPQPVKDATFRDATVKPGVRYVYAVVAVDNATPRNQSPPSPREEVNAR